jgi:hypothetical protein
MMMPTTLHRTRDTNLSRSPRRLVRDFAVAFFVFNIVACAFMPKQMDARAHAGADTDYQSAQTTMKVSDSKLAPLHNVVVPVAVKDSNRFQQLFVVGADQLRQSRPAPLALFLLAFVFAALTALNMQLVRHLREAYARPSRLNPLPTHRRM